MISRAGWWTWTPSAIRLQIKKWNPHIWIMFSFWWSARLVNGLKPHLPPVSNQKNEMLIFVLCSTSNDRLGWSMDSNPILYLSPTKEMKCSFLYYVQLLMIGLAGRWTRTPSTTPLQPKQWNAHFCITFNMWCWPDWSMDLNLIHHPSPAKKWNAHFCITFNFWWSASLGNGLEPHLPPFSSQKNEMLTFGLCSLRMISQAGRWTQTPSSTSLQPKKWNAHICIMFNF